MNYFSQLFIFLILYNLTNSHFQKSLLFSIIIDLYNTNYSHYNNKSNSNYLDKSINTYIDNLKPNATNNIISIAHPFNKLNTTTTNNNNNNIDLNKHNNDIYNIKQLNLNNLIKLSAKKHSTVNTSNMENLSLNKLSMDKYSTVNADNINSTKITTNTTIPNIYTLNTTIPNIDTLNTTISNIDTLDTTISNIDTLDTTTAQIYSSNIDNDDYNTPTQNTNIYSNKPNAISTFNKISYISNRNKITINKLNKLSTKKYPTINTDNINPNDNTPIPDATQIINPLNTASSKINSSISNNDNCHNSLPTNIQLNKTNIKNLTLNKLIELSTNKYFTVNTLNLNNTNTPITDATEITNTNDITEVTNIDTSTNTKTDTNTNTTTTTTTLSASNKVPHNVISADTTNINKNSNKINPTSNKSYITSSIKQIQEIDIVKVSKIEDKNNITLNLPKEHLSIGKIPFLIGTCHIHDLFKGNLNFSYPINNLIINSNKLVIKENYLLADNFMDISSALFYLEGYLKTNFYTLEPTNSYNDITISSPTTATNPLITSMYKDNVIYTPFTISKYLNVGDLLESEKYLLKNSNLDIINFTYETTKELHILNAFDKYPNSYNNCSITISLDYVLNIYSK